MRDQCFEFMFISLEKLKKQMALFKCLFVILDSYTTKSSKNDLDLIEQISFIQPEDKLLSQITTGSCLRLCNGLKQ